MMIGYTRLSGLTGLVLGEGLKADRDENGNIIVSVSGDVIRNDVQEMVRLGLLDAENLAH